MQMIIITFYEDWWNSLGNWEYNKYNLNTTWHMDRISYQCKSMHLYCTKCDVNNMHFLHTQNQMN